MNEDLSAIAPIAQKAIDAGKKGDAEAFVKDAEEALALTKTHPSSASRQRIISRLKTALTQGKSGQLAEGAADIEGAMSDMKKSGPPKFGGGS